VHLTPASTDRVVARNCFSTFEGAGLDGIIAKPLDAGAFLATSLAHDA
jgi:hypothetical protein